MTLTALTPPISLFPSCSQLYACADYSGVALVHSNFVSCFISGSGCWVSTSVSAVSEPRKVSDLQCMWELAQRGQCQTGQKICSLHSSLCLRWNCGWTWVFWWHLSVLIWQIKSFQMEHWSSVYLKLKMLELDFFFLCVSSSYATLCFYMLFV